MKKVLKGTLIVGGVLAAGYYIAPKLNKDESNVEITTDENDNDPNAIELSAEDLKVEVAKQLVEAHQRQAARANIIKHTLTSLTIVCGYLSLVSFINERKAGV